MPVRLGLLGGTFDPIHIGHLVTAVEVRHVLELDRVLLVVAGSPWQKVGTRPITPAADRLAVVRAATHAIEGVEASAIEVEREGPTYTADTLAALHSQDPGAELYLVVGADVASELSTWERVDEVRSGATLVVVDRPGSLTDSEDGAGARLMAGLRDEGWQVTHVEVPHLEVSSTELRARLSSGRPVDFLVPDPAIREIRKRGLYPAGR